MTTVISFAFLTIFVLMQCSCSIINRFHAGRHRTVYGNSATTTFLIKKKQIKVVPLVSWNAKFVDNKYIDLIDKYYEKRAEVNFDDVIEVVFDKHDTTLLYEPDNKIRVIYNNITPYITVTEHRKDNILKVQATITDLRLAPPDYNNNQPTSILTAKESPDVAKSELFCERVSLSSSFTATAFGTSAMNWSYTIYNDTLRITFYGDQVYFHGTSHTITGPGSKHFERINFPKKNRTVWLSYDHGHRVDLTSTKLYYRHDNIAVLRLWQGPRSDFTAFDPLMVVTVHVYENNFRVGSVRWPASHKNMITKTKSHRRVRDMDEKLKRMKNLYNEDIGPNQYGGSFSMHCGVPAKIDASFLGAAIWPARPSRPRCLKLWAKDGATSYDSALEEFGPSPAAYQFIYSYGGSKVMLQKDGTLRLVVEPLYN